MPAKDSSGAPPASPIALAHAHGQSIWLDNISRDLLLSGELRRWVEERGIRGVTSNPAIFEKAIAQTSDYDPAARALIGQGASDALDVFERLAVQDIQLGCDVLRPIWEASEGRDGFVSLEVSPHLANDTEGTIEEARRLSADVARDNLMIKVPATPEGIPAIQQLISDGIHVNVTLLFAVDAYEAVHQAYLAGLEARLERGQNVSGIASVASFFISRIDATVGQHLAAKLEGETRAEVRARLEALDAKVAIANAKLAYARFLETLASDRWARLADAGADPQRVLWASTGTKDPALPKTLYVDELIGRHTVNTLPDATLEAFRTEGRVRDALGKDPEPLKAEAQAVLSELDALGISLKEITDGLLTKGCALFSDAFDGLLLSVETKRQKLLGDGLVSTRYALGAAQADVDAAAEAWVQASQTHALWRKQAAIFSDADERRWMGWLDLPTASEEEAIGSAALREAVRRHPADAAVVIGMGGSSLWPDVLGQTFTGEDAGGRKARTLRILDTTVPDAIEGQLASLDLERCLFFVSSKSGSTIEPNAIFELVHARLADEVGAERAGRHFVAITDPGSQLEARAAELGFLGAALGRPDVGGRFSALSPFGLLPAEAAGLDPEALRSRARTMSAACAPFVSPDQNPGVGLGLALGTLARSGRDKLTLSLSPEIALFSDWIEQLVAESTGKHGKGVVPIAGEPLGEPARYANDRVFVDLAVAGDVTKADREAKLAALEAAGHPVIRIALAERLDLLQEVFRWEVATAVIGAVLELNPFDQPDVESAKVASRELMAKAADGGALPVPNASFEDQGASWIVSPSVGPANDAKDAIAALLGGLGANDTFFVNVFLEDAAAHREILQSLREQVGIARGVATTLDFGPRYLHSTGQLQKGGPNPIVGLQLWQSAGARTRDALAIPGMGGDFDTLAEAQAVGDYSVLAERERSVIGIDVGADPKVTLERLATLVTEALA
ncbi:MAG: bifunctional transaldolase/phosoglucose isomerase [bacterium]|nr:bifunctional transaldolase/phosoglucose isomerase [bacterium]